MSAHQPILPSKAIELVKARNLETADALLADFAAAGLIKTYALVREIRPEGGPIEVVRGAQIPTEDWERIVASEKIQSAMNGRMVRLEGSPLRGGTPSVLITGISFSQAALVKVLDRYCLNSSAGVSTSFNGSEAPATVKDAIKSDTTPDKLELQPIKPGDLVASVAQAEKAVGVGRTTIDKLMREGKLDRKKVGRRTFITVESIEKLLGVKLAG